MSFLKNGRALAKKLLVEFRSPDGIIPVALLRRVVADTYHICFPVDVIRVWTDNAGNLVAQEFIPCTVMFNDKEKKYLCNRLNLDGLKDGCSSSQQKKCLPMALVFCLVEELEADPSNEPRWWLWITNGGNEILVKHEPGHDDGSLRYWVNPRD